MTTENFTGADASGSSGDTNRVLTLSNTSLTSSEDLKLFVNGLRQVEDTNYTVNHLVANTTIVFLNALYDPFLIVVDYFFTEAVGSSYCSSGQIFSFLQLGTTSGYAGKTDFDTTTTPTKLQVEEWIVDAEAEINQRTMNSWKTQTITKEYHTIKPPTIRYEGSKIFMQHRNITTFSSSTDKLEVWNGSEWEDYLISRNEGRNNDYWVNEVDGILFLRTYPRYIQRTNNVRLTYRFGEPTVKSDIRKACIRLAAITAIQSDDKSLMVPEGAQNIPLFEKTKIWQREADKIIQDNREIKNAIL